MNMQRSNGFLSPQLKTQKEVRITLQPVLTEEQKEKKERKNNLVVTQKNQFVEKNIKNKKSIQFKVHELTALETDFGEPSDNIIREKIIIESLDTWSQEKKANGIKQNNPPLKKEESIENIIKNNNKQIEKNKFVNSRQPKDPELSENIINFILNENVQSAYQDNKDQKQYQQSQQNQQLQQDDSEQESKVRFYTQEQIQENLTNNVITEQNEEKEEDQEEEQPWFDRINEDDMDEYHRNSLKQGYNTERRSKSTSKAEVKPKKSVKVIKQSIDAMKFEINKNVINTVVFNKMKRGMNLQKKVENDFLLRNKQLDSKASRTINSFKIVNQTMRKSDFIINYNWLYKTLIENKQHINLY